MHRLYRDCKSFTFVYFVVLSIVSFSLYVRTRLSICISYLTISFFLHVVYLNVFYPLPSTVEMELLVLNKHNQVVYMIQLMFKLLIVQMVQPQLNQKILVYKQDNNLLAEHNQNLYQQLIQDFSSMVNVQQVLVMVPLVLQHILAH